MEVSNHTDYPVRWLSVAFTQPEPLAEGAGTEARLIERMLTSGAADIVHLRKPGAPVEYLTAVLDALPEKWRRRVMLHDHFELTGRFGLRGVQLNSRNRVAPSEAASISVSCHTLEEIGSLAQSVGYVTLSPIFDSISKSGYRATFPPESVAGKLPAGKVIALGGVTPADLFRLRRAGFAGSAMLGWWWQGDFDRRLREASLRLRLLRSFPLLLITHSADPDENLRQAREAYAGGCRWVQVRMKEGTTAQRAVVAKEIMAQCPGMLVCIDDDCEAVALSGAHGVHLGKQDISTREARAILGDAPILGRTANSIGDIQEIAAEGGVDYLGVGPLRFTTTKQRLAPVLGYEGYREIVAAIRAEDIDLPLLAIGGVTPQDVPELLAAGIDGIAVSGAINNAPDPAAATLRFLAALRPPEKP